MVHYKEFNKAEQDANGKRNIAASSTAKIDYLFDSLRREELQMQNDRCMVGNDLVVYHQDQEPLVACLRRVAGSPNIKDDTGTHGLYSVPAHCAEILRSYHVANT